MVEAHVLVHGENDAGLLAGFDGLDCFAIIHSQGFLRENALEGLSLTGGFNQSELVHRWHRNVEHFDGRIVEQLLRSIINFRDSMPLRDFLRAGARARRNRDGIESRLPIGDEVTAIDDKPGAENADAKISSVRQWRVDVEFHGSRSVLSASIGQSLSKTRFRSTGFGRTHLDTTTGAPNSSSARCARGASSCR